MVKNNEDSSTQKTNKKIIREHIEHHKAMNRNYGINNEQKNY